MKIILSLIIALFMFSCTNGDKTKIEVEPILNHKIEIVDTLIFNNTDTMFIGESRNIKIIKDKIFLSDMATSNVKVFDNKMNYLKKIGRNGSGPGEFEREPYLSKKQDSLVAYLYPKKKYRVYNYDATSYSEYKLPENLVYNPMVPAFIDNLAVFSSDEGVDQTDKNITTFNSALLIDGVKNKTFSPFGVDYEKKKELLFFNRFKWSQVSEGFNKTIFVFQVALKEISQYDFKGTLLKKYILKPKYYKNPPLIKKDYNFPSIEDSYEKFITKYTYIASMIFDNKQEIVYIYYRTLLPKQHKTRSFLDAENYLFAFNEQGECLFDEPIPGYLADVADGYIYIVTEESPERFVMLKCQLVKK